jgi:hypothetical protein
VPEYTRPCDHHQKRESAIPCNATETSRERIKKIPDDQKAGVLAFFGVELDGEKIFTSDTSGESGFSIGGVARDNFCFAGGAVVGVDKVGVNGIWQTAPHRVGGIGEFECVPSHVGDFDMFFLEAENLPFQATQPSGSGAFLAAFEQKLEAEADAKVGTMRGEPILKGIVQTELMQLVHAFAECALSRQKHDVNFIKIAGVTDHHVIPFEAAQRVADALQIAGVIIDDSGFHGVAHGGMLQHFLGAGNAADAGVDTGGGIQGATQSFENGFGHVMGIASVKDFGMQGAGGVDGKGAKELLDELEGKRTNCFGDRKPGFQVATSTEVDHDTGECFVHGKIGVPVADDAGFAAQRFTKAVTENNPHVFHRVVGVDSDVAFRFDFQIKKTVAREKG